MRGLNRTCSNCSDHARAAAARSFTARSPRRARSHPPRCASPQGGCMRDPTVDANFHAAASSGLFRAVARYNMRCAGRSQTKSWFTPGGDPDTDDLETLCNHLLSSSNPLLPPGAPPPARLVLIAYSYGSVVAASALARLPQVRMGGRMQPWLHPLRTCVHSPRQQLCPHAHSASLCALAAGAPTPPPPAMHAS